MENDTSIGIESVVGKALEVAKKKTFRVNAKRKEIIMADYLT